MSRSFTKLNNFFEIYCLSLSFAEMTSIIHLVYETSKDLTQTERDYMLNKSIKYYKKEQ